MENDIDFTQMELIGEFKEIPTKSHHPSGQKNLKKNVAFPIVTVTPEAIVFNSYAANALEMMGFQYIHMGRVQSNSGKRHFVFMRAKKESDGAVYTNFKRQLRVDGLAGSLSGAIWLKSAIAEYIKPTSVTQYQLCYSKDMLYIDLDSPVDLGKLSRDAKPRNGAASDKIVIL